MAEVVYQQIAKHFDETRTAYWKSIRETLAPLPAHTVVLDCGCGNGKYTRFRSDLQYIACDITPALLDIAHQKSKGYNTQFFLGSCCEIPLRSKSVDVTICVAVLHHIPTYFQRLQAILELIRVTKEKVVITVWADEQPKKKKWQLQTGTDYLIPWLDKYTQQTHQRLYHLFPKTEVQQLCKELAHIATTTIEYECDNWVLTIYPHC